MDMSKNYFILMFMAIYKYFKWKVHFAFLQHAKRYDRTFCTIAVQKKSIRYKLHYYSTQKIRSTIGSISAYQERMKVYFYSIQKYNTHSIYTITAHDLLFIITIQKIWLLHFALLQHLKKIWNEVLHNSNTLENRTAYFALLQHTKRA